MILDAYNRQVKIAIIESNILACMGLQRILDELIPTAEIVMCESFEELQTKCDNTFVHYFVSSRIYFEHTAYFRANSGRCIVMVSGEMNISGVATLNVCQGEAAMIHDLLKLQRRGHNGHKSWDEGKVGSTEFASESNNRVELLLSHREIEVALLLCQGWINKEIADKLNIALTTVITHRKNIMDKLGARSLADVIIYCVMNGMYSV
jgi:DNA-binding CsgD family transcriptional regulator